MQRLKCLLLYDYDDEKEKYENDKYDDDANYDHNYDYDDDVDKCENDKYENDEEDKYEDNR